MIYRFIITFFFIFTVFYSPSPASESRWGSHKNASQTQNDIQLPGIQELDPNSATFANISDSQVGLEDEIEHHQFILYHLLVFSKIKPKWTHETFSQKSRIDRPPPS